METKKLGGRKFILALISIIFLVGVFIVMLLRGWLDGGKCMQFVQVLPIIVGMFVAGNSVEHYIEKKKKEEK